MRILLIDDEPDIRTSLAKFLKKLGHRVITAGDALEGLSLFHTNEVEVIITDIRMPRMDGLELLRRLKEVERSSVDVIIITGHGDLDNAINALRYGAFDYLQKPMNVKELAHTLQRLEEYRLLLSEYSSLKDNFNQRLEVKAQALRNQAEQLRRAYLDEVGLNGFRVYSQAMRRVVSLAEKFAREASLPILIQGESGTGKELLARYVHHFGRTDPLRPFVAVNCGAIPANLVESTLFGHEKGSFTGATGKHMGKFQEADGGTLFLDEIGELPLDMQVKLLRALQEGEVDPVGSNRPVRVDVRIISATNRDLTREVEAGRFREDLFYRLNVFPIEVPSLRARKEDIPALVRHFITRFNAQESRSVVDAAPETMAMLAAFEWPGNVRQLENAVFRAVVLCEGDYLGPGDFPQISGVMPDLADLPPPPMASNSAAFEHGGERTSLPPVPIMDEGGHLRPLESIERDLIEFAIETYAGRMAEVARRLGLGRSTLYRKVREDDLDVDQARTA